MLRVCKRRHYLLCKDAHAAQEEKNWRQLAGKKGQSQFNHSNGFFIVYIVRYLQDCLHLHVFLHSQVWAAYVYYSVVSCPQQKRSHHNKPSPQKGKKGAGYEPIVKENARFEKYYQVSENAVKRDCCTCCKGYIHPIYVYVGLLELSFLPHYSICPH